MPTERKLIALLLLLLWSFQQFLGAGNDKKTAAVHSTGSLNKKLPVENNDFIYKALGDFQSLTIPLKRAGKLILIDAMIDSVAGNLIFDTGSAGLVLNSIYFRSTRRSPLLESGGITGAVAGVTKYYINQMQLSDVFYRNFEADMTDLGHLERARNIKILGFFGLSVLEDFEVVLDLRNNLLELHRIDKKGKRINNLLAAPKFDVLLPMRNVSNVMFIEGEIGGKELLFCLDTGAESNVLSNRLPDKVLNTVSVSRRSTLWGVGSQKVDVFHGQMNNFSVGKHALQQMPTLITSLSAMAHSFGISLDGMLGCDFFESGIFYIDQRNNKLGIEFYKTRIE
mgnify:CR=1 FL=1